ncbi:MAG: hypothetical protein JSS53_09190 [Proteobacteria bacterium]|nr:hypothetical protein [Pseudomonadota bacterium]
MSKDTQLQDTNSYTGGTRLSGPSKTSCPKCDAKKLSACACPKSDSAENESEENFSAPTKENPILVLLGPQNAFQFTLKPNAQLTDIKVLLEQFIIELIPNVGVDVNIRESGKNLGIDYDDTQKNTLAITIKHPEDFVGFFNLLSDKALIVIKPEQVQEIENTNCQSFNPSPFKTTPTPFEGF